MLCHVHVAIILFMYKPHCRAITGLSQCTKPKVRCHWSRLHSSRPACKFRYM